MVNIDELSLENLQNLIMGRQFFHREEYQGIIMKWIHPSLLQFETDVGIRASICSDRRRIEDGVLMCCEGNYRIILVECEECRHQCKADVSCSLFEKEGE